MRSSLLTVRSLPASPSSRTTLPSRLSKVGFKRCAESFEFGDELVDLAESR